MCLIRRRSHSSELEEICHFIRVTLFALKASLYWGYVPSKANWADPISTQGSQDPWHQREGFTRFFSYFNYGLLTYTSPILHITRHLDSSIFVVPWELVHWD